MAHPFQRSPIAQRLLGLLRQAAATDSGDGVAAITHRLPIAPPGRDVPLTFTLDLTADEAGSFLVTCRELPDLLAYGEDEEEALEMAELALREALSAPPKSEPPLS